MIQPQHTCPEDAAISLQAICEDGSVGASDIFILIVIVVFIAGLGLFVYNLTRKRFDDSSDEPDESSDRVGREEEE